jgi:glutaminyl-tRNA synthetase
MIEPSLNEAQPGDKFQFERVGHFGVNQESEGGKLVFNHTLGLRDTWSKIKDSG